MIGALGWLALALAAAPQDDAAAKSERAARAMLDERFAEAETLYLELLRTDAQNPGLLLNLGLAEQSLGKQREAVERFRAVAKLQPDTALVWLLLGAGYRKLAQPAEAVGPLERVLALEPANRAALLELAEALFDLERYDAAASRYYSLAEAEPGNPHVWERLGSCYVKQARVVLGKLDRESAWWCALTGREHAEAGRFEAALAAYRDALAKDAGLRGVHAAIAEIQAATGHEDLAQNERALEAKLPPPDCTREAPECELSNQRFWQAAEAAGKLSGPRAQYWKALAWYELADVAFARLAELPPSVELHAETAETHALMGRHAAAVKSWQAALALTPDDRDMQRRLAQSLVDAHDYVEARRLLERMLGAQPTSPELNRLLAETLKALNR